MLETVSVDYGLLDAALRAYRARGVHQVETPWVVPAATSLATFGRPEGAFATDRGEHVVGSGEQGFLELARQGLLSNGIRYMTVTPCFRRDDPDETHSRWFVKLELFTAFARGSRRDERQREVEGLAALALDVQARLLGAPLRLEPMPSVADAEFCWDLVGDRSSGAALELGSFGARSALGVTWAFATGLALPRAQLLRPAKRQGRGPWRATHASAPENTP